MSQLEVYIDTSYGLEHEQSRSVHGMLHEWAGAPLQWHNGSQPWIAASTGEAELIGYAEAHQQALSIGSVIELFTEEPKYVTETAEQHSLSQRLKMDHGGRDIFGYQHIDSENLFDHQRQILMQNQIGLPGTLMERI